MAANEATAKIKINVDSSEAVSSLKKFKGAVGGVISALAVREIYQFTKALAEAGMEGIQAEKAFKNFVPNVAEATKALTKASLGMVEDTKLQQQAIQALLSGIKFDDYLTALEYASKFAVSTGKDTEEVLSGIVQSFMTGRSISLKRAGIQVATGKNMVADAVNQMKSKMGELEVSINDPVVKMRMMQAEIANIKDKVGRDAIPILIAWSTGFLDLAKSAEKSTKNITEFIRYMAELKVSAGNKDLAIARMAISDAKALEDKQKAITELKGQEYRYTTEVNDIGLQIEEKEKEIEKRHEKSGLIFATKSEKLQMQINELKYLRKQKEAILSEIALASADVEKRKVKKPTNSPPLPPDEKEIQAKHSAEKKAYVEFRDWMTEDARITVERRISAEEKAYSDFYDFMSEDAKISFETIEGMRKENLSKSTEGQLKLLEEDYKERKKIVADNEQGILELEQWYADQKKEIAGGLSKTKIDALDEYLGYFSNMNSMIESISSAQTQKELKGLDRKKLSKRAYAKEEARILQEGEERSKQFARVQQLLAIGEAAMNIAKAKTAALATPPIGPWNWLQFGLIAASGALEVATIQAQKFQRGFVGEASRGRATDNIPAMIGRNEAVIPGPQFAANEDAVKAIVNNTANTAAGMRSLKGGSVVHNYFGLSSEQVIAVQRDAERRKYTGRLI